MAKPKKDRKEDFQALIVRLETMILTGVFQPGERLVEASLSAKLGVSRFWIRDALKHLEAKELVRVVPYKGAMVSDLAEAEIEEIFEVRFELESLATRLSAQYIDKTDLGFLEKMAEKIEASFQSADADAMIRYNDAFHSRIFERCRNKTMLDMIDQLKKRCHILRHAAWSSPGNIKLILEEHRIYLKALANRDLELLDYLARRHISHSQIAYLSRLRTRGEEQKTGGAKRI